MSDSSPVTTPNPFEWLRAALLGPLASDGDYFERLNAHVRSSAPVSRPCPA